MIAAPLSNARELVGDPYERALTWRARAVGRRAFQALLVGLLTWFGSHDPWVWPWLAMTLVAGGVDGRISRRLATAPRTLANLVTITLAYVVSAIIFSSSALILLRAGSPVVLAGAALVLCAVSLNNAITACGSRLATAALVSPASALLIASPFIARWFGFSAPLVELLLLAAGGVGFSIFIVRLAGALNAEGQGLKVALEALGRQTEAARSAEQLAEDSRRRWRLIFEKSPLPRIVFDASQLHDFLVARGSPGCERLGDVAKAEIETFAQLRAMTRALDANDEALALMGGSVSGATITDAFVGPFAEALNQMGAGGELPPISAELIRNGGEVREIEVHFRMGLGKGEGCGWSLCVATYVDVTEARQAARQQQEALEAAEIANRAKSDFLAVISHEVRTPLNGVIGMAQAMAMNPLARKQRERLEVISDSGAALLAIVDDLLDLSHLEAGQMELVEADVDLQKLVEGVRIAFAAEAGRKGLVFQAMTEPCARGVYRADARRIRQVLGALVSNALKFTHHGEVRVRLSRTDGGVRCEVRDTGIGISSNRIARLFENFVQDDSSMTRRYGGAGLGLALCRGLCRAMGGDISVESTPGQGSVFRVDVPLAPVGRPADDGAESLAERGVRVLAAEDNRVNQLVLESLLAQVGVTPTFVDNGHEAVRAWEGGEWDLILMDMQMPLMDGETAAREIRAREAALGRAPTPIIAVTANAMRHQVDAYRAAGLTEVVSKPIDIEQLFSAMVAAVAGRTSARA